MAMRPPPSRPRRPVARNASWCIEKMGVVMLEEWAPGVEPSRRKREETKSMATVGRGRASGCGLGILACPALGQGRW
ncbi:hypothetical protein PAHAL_1G367400 [Panicum hallii]|uniref:Uncharacterized protein n=1 Tax=Panicum hallii TaxID=206008 RepID=A0A2T8KXE2_9POAL|nr:hypothetical protein PAHAL_1G367400 [Panicum hallii]